MGLRPPIVNHLLSPQLTGVELVESFPIFIIRLQAFKIAGCVLTVQFNCIILNTDAGWRLFLVLGLRESGNVSICAVILVNIDQLHMTWQALCKIRHTCTHVICKTRHDLTVTSKVIMADTSSRGLHRI